MDFEYMTERTMAYGWIENCPAADITLRLAGQ